MSHYCTVEDIQLILPDQIVIGDNLLEKNVTILTADVNRWIDFASNEIDSYLNTIYRVPLMMIKKAVDYSQSPIVFDNKFPEPIPLICARFTVGFLYDEVINAQQEPNVSEWGKNQRSLGYDDVTMIQSGAIVLEGQIREGYRFKRATLLDAARVPRPGEIDLPRREAGK